jgi:glycosyltransferase involved in cell wall biosynthesis
MHCLTEIAQRRIIRRLVRDERISVIHQPIPVSPKLPSLIYGMGVPVVIGPMNGGMDYPPAFRRRHGSGERIALAVGRSLSTFVNWLIPGKRLAAALLVANERTRVALPRGLCSRVMTLVENGVDLAIWRGSLGTVSETPSDLMRLAYMGRLIDWKAVDLLLEAFKRASAEVSISLLIIGDGPERPHLERLAEHLGIAGEAARLRPGQCTFCGWMSQAECATQLQQCDVLVLPSLLECGGAVVLEAMAMGIPVIATAWGGPTDYLDPSCGILVEPTTHEGFVAGLTVALARLARNPQQRASMGRAARIKVAQQFDWEVKVDRILEVYRSVSA